MAATVDYSIAMSQASQKLRADARALPYADRVALIDDLLMSLDEDDRGVAPAWAAEIEQRAREANADQARGMSWADVRATIEAKRLG